MTEQDRTPAAGPGGLRVTHQCACTRPIHDTATVCAHCAFTLDTALTEITEHRGLAYDLDVTLAKQAKVAAGHGAPQPDEPQAKAPGTLKPNPLPYHGGASQAATNLKAVLVAWARVVIEDTRAGAVPTLGPVCLSCRHSSCHDIRTRGLPADTSAGIAAWLRPRIGWLRYHDAGQEAVDEICAAVDQARRTVDRPVDRLFAGPCNACEQDLYATAGARYVHCRTPDCEQVYDVEERRRWLLDALDDHLVNATHASRLLTYLGITLASNSVRMYASKGRIVAHGQDPQGWPLYRLGDVVRTYYTPRRKAS